MNLESQEKTATEGRVRQLVKRIAETEAELQELLGGGARQPQQLDAVIDPETATPILLEQTRRALLESETRFQRLMKRLSALVFETDREGIVIFVNEAVIDITGYQPSELHERNFWDVFFPGKLFKQVDNLYKRFQKGDVTDYELVLEVKGGAQVTLVLNSANHYSNQGDLLRITGIGIDATMYSRALKALRESETRFRTLTDTTSAAIFIIDGERILYANQAATILTGYSFEELVGKVFWDMARPGYQENNSGWRAGGQSNDDFDSKEVKIQTKNGYERWFDLTTGEIQYEDNPAWILTAFDISERKIAEKALQKQTGILQSILSSMREAVVVVDRHGDPVLANLAAESLGELGKAIIEPGQWTTSYRFYRSNKRTKIEEMEMPLARALQGQEVDSDELFVSPSGSQAGTWIVASARPLLDPDGKLQGGVAVFRDITERKQAEEALRESETRFRTIFNQAEMGIQLLSLDGKIVDSNPSMQELLGYSAEELQSRRLAEISHPADVRVCMQLLNDMAAGQSDRFRMEQRFVRKDRRIVWANQTMSLFRDENGDPLYAICLVENITNAKQMENELAEVQGRLIESGEVERLHLAQELHDGPVQDLLGMSFQLKMIRDTIQEDASNLPLRELETTIQQVIGSIRTMCGDLRPPTLAPFGLEKALRSHAERIQEMHPQLHIELNLMNDRHELPERVRLALFRIYQTALMNVIRHAQASQVSVLFTLDAEQIVLEIRDDGRGFEVPNKWIDLVRQGHLGLVGAAERADAIGGKLKVLSRPGQGTSVRVIVPRQDEYRSIPYKRLSFDSLEE